MLRLHPSRFINSDGQSEGNAESQIAVWSVAGDESRTGIPFVSLITLKGPFSKGIAVLAPASTEFQSPEVSKPIFSMSAIIFLTRL